MENEEFGRVLENADWREGETEGDQGAHEMRTLEKSGRRGDVFIADILPIREVEKIITQGSGWAMGWKTAVLVDDMAGWAGIGVGRDRLRKQQFVMP